MTVTQRIFECNSHKQVVLVDSWAIATLKEWKIKPTPWVCPKCAPQRK